MIEGSAFHGSGSLPNLHLARRDQEARAEPESQRKGAPHERHREPHESPGAPRDGLALGALGALFWGPLPAVAFWGFFRGFDELGFGRLSLALLQCGTTHGV